jgi:chemotaxis protein CheX
MVPCPLEPAGDEGLILSVISIIGDVEWSLFMGLPKTTATAVAAKFAGFDIPFDSPDMGDAIGELTNILAGQTKAMLDRRGVKAEIGLPSVMRADNLQVIAGKNTVTAKICFDSPLGRFWTGVLEKGKGLPV